MKPKDIPLGTLIDSLNDCRERKRALTEQEKALDLEYKSLEEQIKVRLAAEGMDKATGKKATASISHTVVADVKDWSLLEKYIKRTGHFQLFQRRISEPSFRELLALKGVVPGVEPFDKISLNLRAINS